MSTDPYGNPLTPEHPGSLAALCAFTEGFVACESRAADAAVLAHTDDSPIAQACVAALQMFAETGGARAAARPHMAQALAGAARVSARERGLIACIAAWVDGDVGRAMVLHEQHVHDFPRDLLALKLGQYHCFNRGDAPAMLRMALAARDAAADVPQLHGMLAFGWEQCHRLGEAELAARTAIGMQRKEPWAHHALAHVMLTQGRIGEGLAFVDAVSDTWTGLNSFMVTHNWWHAALFAIELDRHDAALRLYDEQVWGVAKEYTQDQVNAVSLLARLELAGVDVGGRWEDVARYLVQRTADQVLPFLDLQYLYGLARAGRPEAATLLANMEAHAPQTAAPERTMWQQVALPAARGLLAHAAGDWDTAVDRLGSALPRLAEIGGSHAQRDLFAQIHLDALVRSGRLAGAQNLLQPLAHAQPESRRLARQLNGLYASLGLSGAIAVTAG